MNPFLNKVDGPVAAADSHQVARRILIKVCGNPPMVLRNQQGDLANWLMGRYLGEIIHRQDVADKDFVFLGFNQAWPVIKAGLLEAVGLVEAGNHCPVFHQLICIIIQQGCHFRPGHGLMEDGLSLFHQAGPVFSHKGHFFLKSLKDTVEAGHTVAAGSHKVDASGLHFFQEPFKSQAVIGPLFI